MAVLKTTNWFQKKEWAQDNTYLKKCKEIQRNIDSSSAAFITEDFKFKVNANKKIDNSYTKEVSKASVVNIKWRFQKNIDNRQVLSYVKDTKDKHYCALEACKKIRKRAIKLIVLKDKPIAVYTE